MKKNPDGLATGFFVFKEANVIGDLVLKSRNSINV